MVSIHGPEQLQKMRQIKLSPNVNLICAGKLVNKWQ